MTGQEHGVEEGKGEGLMAWGCEIVVLEITHIHGLQANLGTYPRQCWEMALGNSLPGP